MRDHDTGHLGDLGDLEFLAVVRGEFFQGGEPALGDPRPAPARDVVAVAPRAHGEDFSDQPKLIMKGHRPACCADDFGVRSHLAIIALCQDPHKQRGHFPLKLNCKGP